MNVDARECRRCGGRFEPGFVRDMAEGKTERARWVEGEPVRSFWLGVKTRGRRQLDIRAFRCSRCGFLELYAEDPRG